MVRGARWNQEPCPCHRGPGCALWGSRHWAVFDIPSGSHGLDAGYSANRPAKGLNEVHNDFGKHGYGGPCPLRGHATHHYHFRLLAISRPLLDLKPASASDVLKASEPYAIQRAEL